ncbi:hypothetical protein JL720_13708 [Aureococcus anophagefferens]|nr:hypothetical protein JL720_13708 [Aureococcus anophagefferens]
MRAKPVEEQWKFVEMYAASGGAGLRSRRLAALKSVAGRQRRRSAALSVRTGIRTGAAAWLTGFYGAGGPRAVASVLWCFGRTGPGGVGGRRRAAAPPRGAVEAGGRSAGAMALANELVCGEADADERGALREEVSAAFDESTDDAAPTATTRAAEAARGAALRRGPAASSRRRGRARRRRDPAAGRRDQLRARGAALRWAAEEPAAAGLVSFGAKAKRGGSAAGSLDLALAVDVCPRSGHPDLGSPSVRPARSSSPGGVARFAADSPRSATPGGAFRHMAREDAAAGGDGGGVEAVLDALRKRAAVPRLRAKVEVLGARRCRRSTAAAAAWRDAVDALCDGDVPENLRTWTSSPSTRARGARAPAAPAPATGVASALGGGGAAAARGRARGAGARGRAGQVPEDAQDAPAPGRRGAEDARQGVDPRCWARRPSGLAKYRKMLKMHLPRGAVEQKMRAEGVDPALLDGDAPEARSRFAVAENRRVPYRALPAEDLHRLAARTSAGAVVASFVRTATTKPAARASFVDPRTAQNVGIALRKMRRPPEELSRLVLRGDACPESLLDLLASAAPTAEMRGLALAHRASGAGDDDLDDVERFSSRRASCGVRRAEALDLAARGGSAASRRGAADGRRGRGPRGGLRRAPDASSPELILGDELVPFLSAQGRRPGVGGGAANPPARKAARARDDGRAYVKPARAPPAPDEGDDLVAAYRQVQGGGGDDRAPCSCAACSPTPACRRRAR